MDTPARVGQLLMVGVPVSAPASSASTVRTYHLGGVFLAGRSAAPLAQVKASVAALKAAQPPGTPGLDVALDQEGGKVQTLSGPGFDAVPSALVQGRGSDAQLTQATTRWASQLTDAGVTIDLAPVADTVAAADASSNPPIGVFGREYGSSPDVVASRITLVVRAMHAGGLASTLKHFPGLGRVRQNTDTSTGARDPVATPADPNLGPFAAGISAGADAVMVSSANYPQLDASRIAAFSPPIVTALLRERMGYHRLVVSDDLGRAVAVAAVPAGQRATSFIAAGGDVVLTVNPSDAAPMTAALLLQARQSPAFAALVDAAVLRVLTSKLDRHLVACA